MRGGLTAFDANRGEPGHVELVHARRKAERRHLYLLQHGAIERDDVDDELAGGEHVDRRMLTRIHREFEAGRHVIVAQAGGDRRCIDTTVFIDRRDHRNRCHRRRQPVEMLFRHVDLAIEKRLSEICRALGPLRVLQHATPCSDHSAAAGKASESPR